MKQILFAAVIAAVVTGPGLALAQSHGPAVDMGQPSASSHGPSYNTAVLAQTGTAYVVQPAWSGYQDRAPGVDLGQPSASSHGPAYPIAARTQPYGIYTAPQSSPSAHGPSFGGELSTERSH